MNGGSCAAGLVIGKERQDPLLEPLEAMCYIRYTQRSAHCNENAKVAAGSTNPEKERRNLAQIQPGNAIGSTNHESRGPGRSVSRANPCPKRRMP